MLWLVYFFKVFFISLLFSWLIFKVKNKFRKPILFRFGGLAIVSSFLVGILFNPELTVTEPVRFLLWALLAALFFGLWDDRKKFSWKIQLPFQFILALILFRGGFLIEQISLPWGGIWRVEWGILSFLLFAFWLILLINSVNWLDGKDGLLGVLSFFGAASIFLVSLRAEVNQPALAILSILFLGAVLGFWVFNFPPAKLEAGTSGSYFVGLTLAALALLSGTKIATTLLILTLPIMDALRVIGERWLSGRSIFLREEKRRHLHYLLTEIGWSEKKILAIYSLFWFLALWPELFLKSRTDKFIWLLGEVGVIIIFFVWVKSQIKRQKNRSF